METLPWFWIWVIVAAVLFIGEMLSLSFFMLPFAVGAVLAAICNALGLDLVWQVVVFIAASVLVLIALRPFARYVTQKGSHAKVGAERLVGMQGKVIEGESQSGQFRVLVDGEHWNARSEDCSRLLPDTNIEVLAVESNSLIVKEVPVDERSCSEPIV